MMRKPTQAMVGSNRTLTDALVAQILGAADRHISRTRSTSFDYWLEGTDLTGVALRTAD